MLSWLGMTKGERTGRQFFGSTQKRTVSLVLLTSLVVLFGVKSLLTSLIPVAYLADSIIAVLQGTLGLLVALVYVLILERLLEDKADNKKL